jgi:hypothetical protein
MLNGGAREPLSYGRGVGVRVARVLAASLIRRATLATFSRGRRGAQIYIAVSEPWPFGVVMPSQVPLATYFQWPGS